jgi:hypothetical protein
VGRVATAVLFLAGCGRLGFGDRPLDPDACAVTLTTAARINFNSSRTLAADGGVAPYHYALIGTGATIDADTGVLVARDQPGNVTVTASDDVGCSAQVDLDVGGDTLWYVGGSSNAVPSAQVWKSTDGAGWTLAGSLPDKRTSGALYVFHDQLIWASGSDGVGPRGEVFASSDGTTWTQIGTVARPGVNPGFAVFHDRLWLIGGAASPDVDEVYASDTGAVWTLVGHLPQANHGGATVVAGDKLWYFGGHNNNNGMLYRWALSSSDGVTFQMIGNMATGREYASAIAVDGKMIIAGGQDTTPTTMATVLSTTNGTAFTTETPLPVPRAFTALVRLGELMYSIGGNDGGGVYATGAVTPTPWLQAMPADMFPKPRQAGRVAVFTPP